MNKESVTLRILFTGALVIALLVPLVMIQSLITERQSYRHEAITEIGKGWAGEQTLAGPVLTFVNEYTTTGDGKTFTKQDVKYVLPDDLIIESKVHPEIRYRGIYQTIVYKTDLIIKGNFNPARISEVLNPDILKESYLSFNVSDPRGIKENIKLRWDNTEQVVKPGLKDRNVFKNGFYSSLIIEKDKPDYSFELTLSLNGVESLNFVPVGKNTKVNVGSTWQSPNFSGNFLPATREINENGFTASWNVNEFNRTFPQDWNSSTYNIFDDAFGVRFVIPADEYQQTMRSSKYGILIVLLTFLSFFLVEVFSGKATHPIQYLLIGLALVIFYSLLLALSEYIKFQYSYLFAAVLVIGLISLYVKSIFKNGGITVAIAGLLILFYGFVYVILQLQDYSLLLGNIALLLILASVMFFTRKINWFDVLKGKSKTQG
ncbi:MAG: cell envelope integrity protein CreD [Ignavibacteriales bacterium]|nr:MAG: cell envelope integrity protein CreD [Ignavibacteriales bacterium]